MDDTQLIYSELLTLGHCFSLEPYIAPWMVHDQLVSFADKWQPYNPEKPGYKRFGLSVTSLDGGLSGVPDLTSLTEYNRAHGTHFDEMSFRTPTSVFEVCSTLRPLLSHFMPYLGRCHFLKLETGGFFPYHRDLSSAFRIFVPLHTRPNHDFVFLLGPERIHMDPGHPYFINTRMEHALFVMDGPAISLVLNIEICRGSLQKVHELLAYR